LLAALAKIVHEVMAVIDHRRMALDAMGDGREIEATLDGRVEIGGRHLLVAAGGNIDVHHGLVDWRLHLVAHWRDRSHISNDGIEIARGEDLVETIGHDRRERRAVRPRASGNGPLHVGVAPVTDAGFLVPRSVGAPHLGGWPVPLLRTPRLPASQGPRLP